MADNLDPEYLRDLEASLQASREALDDWTTELLGGTRDTEEERKTRISNNRELAANNKLITEEKKRREDNIDALKKFGSSLLDTSKQVKDALLSTEGGMSKYNKSISSAGDAALNLGKQFGVFGFAVGGIVKLLTLGAEIVTEGNEKLIKSYNDLGEIGATASLTTDELFKFATTAGYGTRNLEGLIKPVKSLGTGLIALGGSTGEGIKKFAQLAATTEEQRAAYRRLGLSQEEVTQLQADYISKTTNSGQRIAASTEKQRKAADEYIESMITLAAFTGTDIKKQQEARDRALANEALNQAIYEKELKRADLQDKLKGEENDVKRISIQKEIDEIGEQIKVKTALGQFAATMLDAKNAQAAYEMAAADGALVLTDSTKALVTAGMNPQKVTDLLNRGEDGIEELVDQFDKAARRNTRLFGAGLSQFGTTYSKNMQDIVGMSNETRRLSVLRMTGEYKTLAEINKAIEDKKNRLGKEDPVLKAEHARLEAEKNTRLAMDSLYKTLQNFVNPALLSFYEAITEIVDWITGFIPGGKDLGSDQDKKRREYKKAKADLKIQEPYAAINPNDKDAQNLVRKNRDIVANYEQKGSYSLESVGIRNSSEAQRSTLGSGRASAILSNSASSGAAGETAGGAANVKVEDVLTFTARSGSKSNFEELESSIKNRVLAAAKEFNDATGKKLIINSAKRDPADQIRLYNETVAAGRPGKGPKGMTVAKPGTSDHERGLAVDIQNYTDNDALVALNKQGLYQTDLQGDPVHFQIPKYGDGGIVDTPQLAWVGDKGREAIVPLSNPDSILAKLLTGSQSEAAAMMPNTGSSSVSNEMIEAMIYKFDTMISYLSEGVDIQQKILRQS